MHQIRFWLGLCPRPRWGKLTALPRFPSWILGALLLREGREGEGGEGRGGEEGEWEEKREGRKGFQGLVHTPMFQILKNTLE